MTRRRLTTPFVLASLVALLALAAVAPAGAKPAKATPAAKVAVGHPVVGTSANGLASILVPVHYPIELKGRLAELRVALIGAGGKTIRSWVLHERLSAGKERLPDRRRRFTFVHRVGLNASLSRRLREGASVRVVGSGKLDIEGDGRAEMNSHDRSVGKPLAGPLPKPVCSSVPHLRVKRAQRVSLPLPVCDRAMNWKVVGKGSRGFARVRAGRLIYKAPSGFRGSDQIELASAGVRQYAQITVGAGGNYRVRALGDSVTAGFGYYGTGGAMGGWEFFWNCKPAAANFNDACSSNSVSKKSKEGAVEYATDYGLAENVSWVAQWATTNNVTDFKNLAISGSEPRNWAPSQGVFYRKTKEIEEEQPDYILLTVGANPMLSNMLLEPSKWWCALIDRLPEFEQCIRKEFVTVKLRTYLRSLYGDLLKTTSATIYVMQYHLSIPVSAVFDSTVEITRANQMLNEEIAAVVNSAKSSRLVLVTPPHFNVGIDIRQVYPAGTTCPPADGPSVQSSITQDELELHSSYCEGPETEGEPDWVIAADSGIHPSITGYTQMASKVPPTPGG